MLQSKLFASTLKQAPKEAVSASHQYLVQAGYVDMLLAGVYSYLPLGWRVISRINHIVRQEMDATGAQEMLMPALQSRGIWDETGRWQGLQEIMYQFQDASNKEVGLAPTHEEVIYDVVRRNIQSYKQLPMAVYQIQNKFRHELRPKGGLMRGREFMMKDLYSFHLDPADLQRYYEQVIEAYHQVFKRCQLEVKVVEASGGVFTDNYSHEFQVISEAGEDTIVYCDSCGYAQNVEIAKHQADQPCPKCSLPLKTGKSIEAGNIFQFGDKYAKDMHGYALDDQGQKQPILMASYGIGISRLMATIVEVHHDDQGIIWPASVAPFQVHLISLNKNESAQQIYQTLTDSKIDVLYDDRQATAGEKFHDADLIGIPWRWVVSAKTQDKIEVKSRASAKTELVDLKSALELIGG